MSSGPTGAGGKQCMCRTILRDYDSTFFYFSRTPWDDIMRKREDLEIKYEIYL
jgi:hypothetical protein